MPNRNYQKGYRFERRIRFWYEKNGWYAMESRGSHGIFDVLALKIDPITQVLLIHCCQAKTNGSISKKDKADCIAKAKAIRGTPLLAYRKNRKLMFKELS